MKKLITPCLLVISLIASSCADFLALDAPVTQVSRQQVFSTDPGAKSAVAGVLAQMTDGGAFASGGLESTNVLAGLSADDLTNYNLSPDYVGLENNSVAPTSSPIASNWSKMYEMIYQVNSIIEGLEANEGSVSSVVRKQTIAEARFIRAFTYFYLVNMFGDVPLVTTTDYRLNRVAKRTPVADVYNAIVADLLIAENDLPTDYSISFDERIHPNSRAASAMLARTYLYMAKWSEAELAASRCINDGLFKLTDLNSVFLANSEEAIWQLMTADPIINTSEGSLMILESIPRTVGLSQRVIDAFQDGDQRKDAWTQIYTSTDDTEYPYAYKYKVLYQYEPITEYYMMLRLGEQYLIRAEARIQSGKIGDGIDDLNAIRVRAGLSELDGASMSKAEALLAVEQERRVELFAEWGHRWFDLKRTNRADAVLGPVKPDWQSKDVLFPIPQSEIAANPNLIQN
jgi:starch-binding outer membrane protein, SusD/RagB family